MTKYQVIIFWSDEDQAYIAEVQELAGCAAHGPTQEAALSNVNAALALWIDTAKEFGGPVPQPRAGGRCSPESTDAYIGAYFPVVPFAGAAPLESALDRRAPTHSNFTKRFVLVMVSFFPALFGPIQRCRTVAQAPANSAGAPYPPRCTGRPMLRRCRGPQLRQRSP